MRQTLPKLRQSALFLIPLIATLILRLLLWEHIPRSGLISDEGEYLSAAQWLADGRGFDWYQGYLWTRAPLYPLFVALHLRLFGSIISPIFISQSILSIINVLLVFQLARRLAPNLTLLAPLAALLTGIYLPFALYTQTLLSETLFITLILCAFLALTTAYFLPRHAIAAGILFGLATLTRSITLGFLPIVAIWLFLRTATSQNQALSATRNTSRSIRTARSTLLACYIAAAMLTILPWSLYNSRLYGGPVLIDTSGAFNLLLGARTAYDGKRSDAQVRDFALGLLGQPTAQPVGDTCAPYPGYVDAHAARQNALTREGLCLIIAKPAAFATKSLGELIDLFQINYTGAERFTNGFSTGRLEPSYVLALFLLDDTLYVLALPLAILGWALARTRSTSPLVSLTGLWWAYNLAIAPLLFAINRFRLPLMPMVFIFAVWAVLTLRNRGEVKQSAVRTSNAHTHPTVGLFIGLCTTLALLLFLVAATPQAYLEPRAPGADSQSASYLGPYPSSLAITGIAIAARPRYENDLRFKAALQHGQFDTAAHMLTESELGLDTRRIGPALVAAQRGQLATALTLLPGAEQIIDQKDLLAAVVRGDILRSQGQQPAALATLSARFVDDANPLEWAWEWLKPAPTTRINIGGSLDIGYIKGCYLGEGDTTISPPANFRWCSDAAQLRFPGAATGNPQVLILRADGRAWRSYAAAPPAVRVILAGREIGIFTPDGDGVGEFRIPLPANQAGSDIEITLHTPTFIPDAARYNSQQGKAVVGQVQRLGVRLDWAEVQNP
ncbi:MAG: glycosyltransferase family 39 protein [Roseiflexaceae bacterium]|nr:glycosyltransferase family 39 protein [Roseiflexaceae bacterium]